MDPVRAGERYRIDISGPGLSRMDQECRMFTFSKTNVGAESEILRWQDEVYRQI